MNKTINSILAGIGFMILGFAGLSEAQTMNKQSLNARQQAIVPIAAFTAKGDLERLKTALNEGLDAGMTVNEIKEVLVQMYAYTGFPRSLSGLNTFIAVLDERAKKGIEDEIGKDASPLPADKTVRELGTAIQTGLVGRPVSGPVYDFAPVIDRFLKEHLFGDIFGRDILGFQERELATVAALAALPAEAQLRSHLNVSMNTGLSEAQMRQFVSVLGGKVGQDEAERAGRLLEIVLKSRPAAAGK
ncbi:MAG: carboxymuconolactone decarboxylase family protein [Candidatus Accumulibacter sp.]|jgi:alkylhydroperoxidase/carboxymuconolactone decarboxylase family protein YurZ|nr:carboxymuconolactone decarboxylase family protein [Accumulibacter sp.]